MQRERTPDEDTGPDRKRKRKVLSCTDCRRRKVQCDRGNPACGRCAKAGKTESCTYEEESLPFSSGHSNGHQTNHVTSSSRPSTQGSVTISREVWDDLFNRILQQERTIEQLSAERSSSIARRAPSYTTTPHFEDHEVPESIENTVHEESILFRGKGFKTLYYGTSDARSSMALVS